MKRYYGAILAKCVEKADLIFKFQVMDPEHPDFGGIHVDARYVEPKSTIYMVSAALSAFLNNQSRYYKHTLLFDRMVLAIRYARRNQREDGTFDLLNCNFYSAADTAFCLYALIPSYRLLLRYGFDSDCEMLAGDMLDIIRDAAAGIAIGGFHTPNHRWAIASILMSCRNILGDDSLAEEARRYLREGIDINEEGEYAERSAAIYNGVNNTAMITLYEETGEEQYLENVRRNLEMTLSYFEPDGSIFTNNSTRQDRGERAFPSNYFYMYLYLAEKYGIKSFEAAAHQILQNLMDGKGWMPDCLDLLMLHDNLSSYELTECGFPEQYHRYFRESGIVRSRKNGFSYSIVQGNTKFLFFQSGSLLLHLRIGASFFEKRYFQIQEMHREGDSYVLRFKARAWYYTPFDKLPETSDWWKMENDKREKMYKKDLEIVVSITEKEKGVDVHIKTDGVDRVPLRVEIGTPAGSIIDANTFYLNGSAGDSMLVRDGFVTVTEGADRVSIGPGFGTHQFVAGKHGSEARGKDEFTLYYTDFTNFDRTIAIEKVF